VGAPLDLYDKPANLFVAGFIGSPAMNLLNGHARDGKISLAGNIQVLAPTSWDNAVVLGIRPEHLDLVPAETDGSIGVRVTAIERTGYATLIICDVEGLVLTALVTDRPGLSAGDRIYLKPRADKLHLFDPTNGAVIG
jgi:multiple sugar transport system ATP-binding protein